MIKYNLNLIYAILKEFDIPKYDYTFTCDSLESYCPSQVKVNNYTVDLLHGASQICFFCKDLNYVIKIPIFYGEDYYYLDNGEEARTVYKYCGAIDEGDGSNYCEEAFITYKNACRHNLKEFFAAIEKVGNWGEIPIYVQWVCYTWHKKKDMPKGLYEGCEFRGIHNQISSFRDPYATSVNWRKNKNHYSIGTTAYNPYKPLRGSRLETPIKIQIVN